jgi:hypothetical protein
MAVGQFIETIWIFGNLKKFTRKIEICKDRHFLQKKAIGIAITFENANI